MLITRKEALHESLKALSPARLHYVWGLLDGLRHIENISGKTGRNCRKRTPGDARKVKIDR